MNTKWNILIVDDDKELLQSCAKIISKSGDCRVVTISDSVQAETEIENGQYDLIISDLAMPNRTGLDLLRKAQSVAPTTPFVIFTAFGSVDKAVEAMQSGAFDFIEKPFKADRLRLVVSRALGNNSAVHLDESNFDGIVGASKAMRQIFKMIERVARGESNVTIMGESGTGKELVARSIHINSARKHKAFVPVNCGAFPENLFESELFGHEKGSFTGAHRRKPGLLEFANGGTFFLDEICELSPALQVKLLRMLQDRKIRRVGGTGLIDVDVRIISASNQNLDEALREGTLREDLYYRLNVISIHLPSLRERKEDIPLLCDHFIEKYAKRTPKSIKGVSPEAMKCFEEYAWPGNVRELENVIERAITLTTGGWIRQQDLPEKVAGKLSLPPTNGDLPLKTAREEVVEKFEKDYLINMLMRHRGNVTRAAKASRIDRRTFHRMLKRYHIDAKAWKP